jgi:hypothetical protein
MFIFNKVTWITWVSSYVWPGSTLVPGTIFLEVLNASAFPAFHEDLSIRSLGVHLTAFTFAGREFAFAFAFAFTSQEEHVFNLGFTKIDK